jgi:hypothetical protein
MVNDVLDELDCFGCAIFYEWFILDLFGELVNSHKDILETALGFLERSYLATFTLSDEFFCVFQTSWSVESGAECFTDQRS